MTVQTGIRESAVAQGSVFKGAMLVSGTMIGGGMLALPVATAEAGMVPTVGIYFISWLFMALTGLLLFEVNLWHSGETNLVTMAEKSLGRWGKAATWSLYLFMFYCLMTAYTVGVAHFFGMLFPTLFSGPLGLFAAGVCFLPVLIRGAKLAGKLNLWLIAGLGLSYVLFVIFGAPHVDLKLVSRSDWSFTFVALPFCFAAFAYQGIVPTLSTYLGKDPKKVTKAIWIGTVVPLIVYIVWEFLILGIVPKEALITSPSAVEPLKLWLSNPYIDFIGESFAFFALFTSFLGVALGLVDFLADGLSVKKSGSGKWLLGVLVLVPPIFFNLIFGNLFLKALGYAGGIGSALLLGLLPILMAWRGRNQGLNGGYRLFGGKILLSALTIFVLFELSLELTKL